MSASSESPKLAPGSMREIGLLNTVITRVLGLASGGPPPHVFTTLARHRVLFRRWLVFAGGLMPGGKLARSETELVILDVAARMGSDYEWAHHERLARRAGVSKEAIACVRMGDCDDIRWSPRERAMLRASAELFRDRLISDATFAELEGLLDSAEILELCLLIGHYQMLAMTLNSLKVQLER